MMLPFLISGICVLIGFGFVMFAFFDPPWWLQPFFQLNLVHFLSQRTQMFILGAFLIVVPPTLLLGFSEYLLMM